MERTQIYLTSLQKKKLKQNNRKYGLSSSELIRRLIDKYFEEVESKDDKEKHNN